MVEAVCERNRTLFLPLKQVMYLCIIIFIVAIKLHFNPVLLINFCRTLLATVITGDCSHAVGQLLHHLKASGPVSVPYVIIALSPNDAVYSKTSSTTGYPREVDKKKKSTTLPPTGQFEPTSTPSARPQA